MIAFRILFTILLVGWQLIAVAQQETPELHELVDERDGRTYLYTQYAGLDWMTEHLRFESPGSYCYTDNGKKRRRRGCVYGNFYPYTELDSVCPAGWHVVTKAEWRQSIDQLFVDANVERDSFEKAMDSTRFFSSNTCSITLLDLPGEPYFGPLFIFPSGWVQGKRFDRQKTQTTIWVVWPEEEEPPGHAHISDDSYRNHRHEHHTHDEPKKQRRFHVRCVRKTGT